MTPILSLDDLPPKRGSRVDEELARRSSSSHRRGSRTSSGYHHRSQTSDPTRLAPEDASLLSSNSNTSPRGQRLYRRSSDNLQVGSSSRHRSRSRRSPRKQKPPGVWRKILWVRQPHPDNYTDHATFLDHMQLNPRIQPYDFWPLLADSTVIVQHVCSVIIFVCCFVGIFEGRLDGEAGLGWGWRGVGGWGGVGTIAGWIMWERWGDEGDNPKEQGTATVKGGAGHDHDDADNISSNSNPSPAGSVIAESGFSSSGVEGIGLGLSIPANLPVQSTASSSGNTPISQVNSTDPSINDLPPASILSARLATFKSAMLIYCCLLGLSPILKSLTKSTTSDSIWAMSCWLMAINIFFFDYSTGSPSTKRGEDGRGGAGTTGVKFPASLSTNAALMASTVLASRLPSTRHVFSLTLFSIQVFGLFPAFRRRLRQRSWRGHVILTLVLVLGAGAGVGVTISGEGKGGAAGGWRAALVGAIASCLVTGLAMGGCSWWLIGLQKYKNEIHGPWDPARPVIRRHWD